MTFNDPIAELLIKVRNASTAEHRYVDVVSSKEKLAIIQILKEQGFIESFLTGEKKNSVRIFLRYAKNRKPAIQALKRVSSPGLRVYSSKEKLPKVRSGLGIAIVSTSQGIMDDATARKMGVGGELLCYVW